MTTPEKFTVIGAGHGGKAMAAHLALLGLKVSLYNRTPDHISVIQQRGGIDLESAEGGPGKLPGTIGGLEALMSEKMPERIERLYEAVCAGVGAHELSAGCLGEFTIARRRRGRGSFRGRVDNMVLEAVQAIM